MTDQEELEALLTKWGVKYSIKPSYTRLGVEIECEEGLGPEDETKIRGYCGFITVFEFDIRGKFIVMSLWE